MNVIKRDGSVVQYDRSKIVIALTKANDAVEEHEKATHEQIDAIADFISNKQKSRILVEDIQDMVDMDTVPDIVVVVMLFLFVSPNQKLLDFRCLL